MAQAKNEKGERLWCGANAPNGQRMTLMEWINAALQAGSWEDLATVNSWVVERLLDNKVHSSLRDFEADLARRLYLVEAQDGEC